MPDRPLLQPIALRNIKLEDGFWAPWHKKLVDVTLPTQFAEMEKTSRIENFRRVIAGEQSGQFGFIFDDSDVYKWLEACAYITPSAALQAQIDLTIDLIERAQDSSGYLFTYYQLQPDPERRWRNLGSNHEMYCAGHLIEAAVAFAENTNDRRLLAVAKKFADHILSIFGEGKRKGYCGHEELELALLRLAKVTGEEKYAEHARWMVETRGSRPSPFEAERRDPVASAERFWGSDLLREGETFDGEYYQDHLPIREHTDVVGHAVRAMYLYIAASQFADAGIRTAIERAWQGLVARRMYVTGGIGPSRHNEGFTTDYDLPNLTAYAETCAAIGLALWGRAMTEMTGESTYIDTVERAIFNGAMAGISLSGDHYFYDNPLESRGTHHRTPWFPCACCPPNLARMIGSIGNFLLSESEDSVYLHIPAQLTAQTRFGEIKIEANYPWSGKFKVTFAGSEPKEFALRVRLPDWSEDVETELPGATEEAEYEQGYAVFRRTWTPGDALTIDYGIEAHWIESHPRVLDNLGRVAVVRGPIVYCAEAKDLGFEPQAFIADTESEILVHAGDDFTRLEVEGFRTQPDFEDELYAPEGSVEIEEATAKLIPYFAWNNRGPNGMQVWLRKA
jgi:uncharacterized protein